jgi:nitroreductase
MDFFDVIEKRYSHKEGFLPDAVPLDDLEKIAAAGLAAPSGMNRQCVKLVILKDREALQPLCGVSPTIGLRTAPSAIALLTDSSSDTGFHNFELEDYAAAAENMLLAAVASGYVSLWLDYPYFNDDTHKAALALLGAPETHRLRVMLPVGLPDGDGARRGKLPFEARVSYGRFGQGKA